MTGSEEDDEFTVESESGSEEHASDSEGIYMYMYSVAYGLLDILTQWQLVLDLTTTQTEHTTCVHIATTLMNALC